MTRLLLAVLFALIAAALASLAHADELSTAATPIVVDRASS
jgi:hypothetical protein